MRFRIALAISISVLLIGVASWYRFPATQSAQGHLVAIGNTEKNSESYNNVVRQLDESDSSVISTTTPVKPLTGAELIGRGLILDYVELAASGQATDATLEVLANRYVESIPTLNSAPTVTYANIKTVSNTKSNFQTYANNFREIHESYAKTINNANTAKTDLNNLNSSLYSFALIFSSAYTEAASRLQSMSVPTALVQVHLQLVNSYLSSAAAMKSISKTEEDSVAAFAGLITLNDNLKKEDVLVAEISKILTLNGI